jgi:hypothetical protein
MTRERRLSTFLHKVSGHHCNDLLPLGAPSTARRTQVSTLLLKHSVNMYFAGTEILKILSTALILATSIATPIVTLSAVSHTLGVAHIPNFNHRPPPELRGPDPYWALTTKQTMHNLILPLGLLSIAPWMVYISSCGLLQSLVMADHWTPVCHRTGHHDHYDFTFPQREHIFKSTKKQLHSLHLSV